MLNKFSGIKSYAKPGALVPRSIATTRNVKSSGSSSSGSTGPVGPTGANIRHCLLNFIISLKIYYIKVERYLEYNVLVAKLVNAYDF